MAANIRVATDLAIERLNFNKTKARVPNPRRLGHAEARTPRRGIAASYPSSFHVEDYRTLRSLRAEHTDEACALRIAPKACAKFVSIY